jgi:hypothetical protein
VVALVVLEQVFLVLKMDSVLILLPSYLIAPLFLGASSAGLVDVVVAENPKDCSTRPLLHLPGFGDPHIEIRHWSENIPVAQPRAVGLLDLVVARRGKDDLFRYNRLARLGTSGYHPLYRRRFRREGGSVV